MASTYDAQAPVIDHTSVTILANSEDPCGTRLTTFLLVYPLMIHNELLTHRVFSRNSASSRAIPVEKMIEAVEQKLFIPTFHARQKGMASNTVLPDHLQKEARAVWLELARNAIEGARTLTNLGVAKSEANRPLAPYSYITTVLSGTEWDGFYAQRTASQAEPRFQTLAKRMFDAWWNHGFNQLLEDQWHIPWLDNNPTWNDLYINEKVDVSTARSARTSYASYDGDFTIEDDLKRTNDLIEQNHWSPLEHCAQVKHGLTDYGNFGRCFLQYRKRFPSEKFRTHDVLTQILKNVYGDTK